MSQPQTAAAVNAAALNAFVMKSGDKFTCIVDGKQVGRSKHQDYFNFHYRRADIKALAALKLEKFVYLDDKGGIAFVVSTDKTTPTGIADIAVHKEAKQVAKLVLVAA